MTKLLPLFFLFISMAAIGQSSQLMTTPENAKEQFAAFMAKKKFYSNSYSPGISDEKLRPILSEKINEVARLFKNISESEKPTQADYLEAIRQGLLKFPEEKLGYDSEDRERILLYFQELMDIVNLKSSNGQLNRFYYGFDVQKTIKKN